MTDPKETTPVPPTEPEPPERVRIEETPLRRSLDALPLFYVAGFLILAGSLYYLYRNPSVPAAAMQESARVETLQQQVQTLATRLAELEKRPAPAAANLGPIEARITALEARPVSAAGGATVAPAAPVVAPDLAPIIAPLQARIAAIEAKPAPVIPPPVDLAPLTTRLDAAAAKQGADTLALTARIDALDSRTAGVEKQAAALNGQITGVADRATRVTRVQAATTALLAGQRLGEIPGAPPALARFANDAPPTEAVLRQSFGPAAEAAVRASQPAIMDDQPLGNRLWTRAQQSVTVRQGDRVLLGDPIAGITGRARQALDAGDLAGAVAALDGLAGPAAAAMAEWKGQARAVLDARAALAAMARG